MRVRSIHNIKYKELNRANFDKKASYYFDTWDGKYSKLMYTDTIKEIIQTPFESILDVGCGLGVLLSIVRSQVDGIELYGIDLSSNMINTAISLLGNEVELVHGDAESLPWEDDSFDLIVCNASFHHYPDPVKALKEMRRVLNKSGRLILADPWWPGLQRKLINLYLRTPLNKDGDVKIYSKEEFVNMLSKVGFSSIHWEQPSRKYFVSTACSGK